MKKYSNPNFIYIVAFIVPFIVFSLGWSTIYPKLTPELFGFYLTTFIAALLIGLLIDRFPGYVYKPIPVYKYNIAIVLGIYVFYVLDCLYMGVVPLISFSSGQLSYSREDFGIPGLHLLMVTYNAFFSVYLFHQYLSNRKRILMLLYILTLIPFVFLMQRSSLMHIVIGSGFLFILSQKRISFKKVIRLSLVGLFVIFMFGYLGNIRSAGGDSTFIARASGATEEFLTSSIPKEFYWGYLYISSPVANLQNNINLEQHVNPDYLSFAVFELSPHFFSKVLTQAFMVTERHFNQVNSFLNVGSIYVKPFSYLSWSGMYIIFFYFMILMNVYYLVVKKSFLYGATGLSLMFTLIALATFENTLVNSQFSFPLIFPFIFSILKGLRKAEKKPLHVSSSWQNQFN